MPISSAPARDDSLRVAFLSHSPLLGGAERALLELLEALRLRGISCRVILPWWGPLSRALSERRIPYRVLPYFWWMGKKVPWPARIGKAIFNRLMLLPVVITIKRWRCRIVYTNTLTIGMGAMAAHFLKLPHVLHIQEFGDTDHGLAFDAGEKRCLAILNRVSFSIIACSGAVAERFRPHFPNKVTVIPPAVHVPYLDSETAPGNNFLCAILGLLQPGKGQEDAIRAVAQLRDRGIKATLLIVGRPSDKRYVRFLSNLVARLRLKGEVFFAGYQENPLGLMKKADVLLMCSRAEAFGRVTVEAMKLGKPVIGARGGATPELIEEGSRGFLYRPGDSSDLAQKIRYLVEHPEKARQMGENARRWASEQFTLARYGQEVAGILESLQKLQLSSQE